MSNVLNYFDLADPETGDNAFHLTGSVYVTGTQFIDSSITVTTGHNVTMNSGSTLNLNSGSTIDVNSNSFTAAKLGNILLSNEYLTVSANGALNIYGFNIITGGTGLSGLTLAAPQPGVKCVINVASISSGTCIVTTAAGVTFDGTNNTATFNAVNDQLVLLYNSSTRWQIAYNNSVTLSSV